MKIRLNKRTKFIILWAFVLHTLWEFGQCVHLYDMWDWPFWEATLWMWVAIFGDILIVLILWKAACSLISSATFDFPGLKGYTVLIGISFLASIFLEWAAIYLNLWDYTAEMPSLNIFNHEVGLSPILQITFLPALSIYLAERFHGE